MTALTLDQTALREPHVVTAVTPPPGVPEWGTWLEDIGFLPGERVTLMAKAALGGDPMVVRIGQSTFALRRAEAACVQVARAGQAA
jgi:ferrous iron transport protein A